MLDNDLSTPDAEVWIILTGESAYFNTTDFVVAGLTQNTYYTFRARSLNEHGWSSEWNS
jgi:hypothetical protein